MRQPGSKKVLSHPTMCLHCHLIVEMFHEPDEDPVKGAWQCPRCGYKYLFSHWKIKRAPKKDDGPKETSGKFYSDSTGGRW